MLRFLLNGTAITIEEADPHLTLLQWLRNSGRTGSKEGCAEGECGACAVAVLREHPDGLRYDSINSCLLPLPALSGRSIVTVEGIANADGSLHHVQKEMAERAGSQCGYCTPGFVVSLFCEFYRPGRSGYDPESISGNLCRCTGYRPIVDIARALPAPAASDPRLPILRERALPLAPICYTTAGPQGPCGFARPSELSALLEQWARWPDATLIAGGTDLMVYANQRDQRWPKLISIEALPELRRFTRSESELVLGAGLELASIEERLQREQPALVPMLEQLWPLFSSRLIRNRATLGGSLGTASPIGDAAPVLLALDASLTLVSKRGERRLPLREFFVDYRKTALAAQELILSVHIPVPEPAPGRALSRFYKVSKRVLDDISTVAGAFALRLDSEDRVSSLRVAYGGIAATPLAAPGVEQLALGRPWDRDTRDLLLSALAELGTPQSDQRGQARYRRAMIGKLFEKFFAESAQAHDSAREQGQETRP